MNTNTRNINMQYQRDLVCKQNQLLKDGNEEAFELLDELIEELDRQYEEPWGKQEAERLAVAFHFAITLWISEAGVNGYLEVLN